MHGCNHNAKYGHLCVFRYWHLGTGWDEGGRAQGGWVASAGPNRNCTQDPRQGIQGSFRDKHNNSPVTAVLPWPTAPAQRGSGGHMQVGSCTPLHVLHALGALPRGRHITRAGSDHVYSMDRYGAAGRFAVGRHKSGTVLAQCPQWTRRPHSLGPHLAPGRRSAGPHPPFHPVLGLHRKAYSYWHARS
jgi:hypothetical protein